MEVLPILIAGIIFVMFLVSAAPGLLYALTSKFLGDTPKRDYVARRLPTRKLHPNLQKQLELGFPFYAALEPSKQLLFESRVQKFIDMKTFEGRGVREIHDKAKVLIAGCAVQLTFGHPHIYFEHFWKIIVYKDKYKSQGTGQMHYGEVNPGGVIVLSWERFLYGIKGKDDGIHLGLHEMAHAMKLENLIHNSEYRFFTGHARTQFLELANQEIQRMKTTSSEEHFLRSYAQTNIQEFFAVSIEHFFEKPEHFNASHSELFETMTQLMRLDPRDPNRDFIAVTQKARRKRWVSGFNG